MSGTILSKKRIRASTQPTRRSPPLSRQPQPCRLLDSFSARPRSRSYPCCVALLRRRLHPHRHYLRSRRAPLAPRSLLQHPSEPLLHLQLSWLPSPTATATPPRHSTKSCVHFADPLSAAMFLTSYLRTGDHWIWSCWSHCCHLPCSGQLEPCHVRGGSTPPLDSLVFLC